MDDVTRLFRALVQHLAEHDPRRLSAPFQVSELYQSLIPYRLFKSELGFGSIEDYEMAILRLLAGYRGFVVLDPPDVQEVLQAEAEAVAPDTGAFRDFAGARIILDAESVRAILDEGMVYAPPEPNAPDFLIPQDLTAKVTPPVRDDVPVQPAPLATDSGTQPAPGDRESDGDAGFADSITTESPPHRGTKDGSASLVFEPVEAPAACPDCHRSLPKERSVSFCPFCGALVTPGNCVRCGDTIEPTWRYCGTCGAPATG